MSQWIIERSIERRSNIFDPIQPDLDQKVYDGIEPKKTILHFIEKLYYRALDQELGVTGDEWADLYLTGSLTTYQYSETSDCDVSVFPDYDKFYNDLGLDADEARKRLIHLSIEHLDGTFLPGTTHPIQFFVVPKGQLPGDLYQHGLRSAYSFNDRSWFVPPEKDRVHDISIEYPELYARASAMADKMNQMLDAGDTDAADQMWQDIHRKRQLDQRAGLGDFSEGNIVYKWFLHQGLFDRIRNELHEYIAKTSAAPEWTSENPPGMPRPLFDNRPVPWTSEQKQWEDDDGYPTTIPDFSVIDRERQLEAFRENLCVLCGDPLTDPVHCFGNDSGDLVDGGLHPRCARMTAAWCPHIKDQVANGEWYEVTVPLQSWITEPRNDFGGIDQIPENNFIAKTADMPPAEFAPQFKDQFNQTEPEDEYGTSEICVGYDWKLDLTTLSRLYQMNTWPIKHGMQFMVMSPDYPGGDAWKRLLGLHQRTRFGTEIFLHPFQTLEQANATLWHEIQHEYQRLEDRSDFTNYDWKSGDPSQYSEHPMELDANQFAEVMRDVQLIIPNEVTNNPKWVPNELHLDRGEWNDQSEAWELSEYDLAQELAAQVHLFRTDYSMWRSTWMTMEEYEKEEDAYYSKTADLWDDRVTTKVIYDFDRDKIILGTQATQAEIPDSKIIGDYTDNTVTLYDVEKQWISPSYFRALWHWSYPDKPLEDVYYQRGDDRVKLRTIRRRSAWSIKND